ncbi:hypothetical protein NE865_01293 [Phthorimaea operculella]|nr:hypothetical protein NE865_01293 [Phthorimaea operculella]
MRLKSAASSKLQDYCDKRNFAKAEACYQKTMNYLQPERNETSIEITLHFFDHLSLWPFQNLCTQILDVSLYFSGGKSALFNIMLTNVHAMLFLDVIAARYRMKVMYELLKSNNNDWITDTNKLLPFITRLLDLFARSEYVSVYTYLRKGFVVCLKRIFEKADNRNRLIIITTMLDWFGLVRMCDDDVLEFCSMLDRAAELYKADSYIDSFNDSLVNHVLIDLLSSQNECYSLMGSRLMLRFLDRQGNSIYLESPIIFYDFTQMKLVVGKYDSRDKDFIRHHRETIHVCLLEAMQTHCHSSVNINTLFLIICCIVLEVPCGLTAAAAACIVMSVQDVALNGENISATARYWMHAIVISVMSLICWVHKSPVLYSYVNKIISRRAREAPQLNPPLMHVYNISHHHVTWNKPTLFFEDWELRYGMWKHFAGQKDKRNDSLPKTKGHKN